MLTIECCGAHTTLLDAHIYIFAYASLISLPPGHNAAVDAHVYSDYVLEPIYGAEWWSKMARDLECIGLGEVTRIEY